MRSAHSFSVPTSLHTLAEEGQSRSDDRTLHRWDEEDENADDTLPDAQSATHMSILVGNTVQQVKLGQLDPARGGVWLYVVDTDCCNNLWPLTFGQDGTLHGKMAYDSYSCAWRPLRLTAQEKLDLQLHIALPAMFQIWKSARPPANSPHWVHFQAAELKRAAHTMGGKRNYSYDALSTHFQDSLQVALAQSEIQNLQQSHMKQQTSTAVTGS